MFLCVKDGLETFLVLVSSIFWLYEYRSCLCPVCSLGGVLGDKFKGSCCLDLMLRCTLNDVLELMYLFTDSFSSCREKISTSSKGSTIFLDILISTTSSSPILLLINYCIWKSCRGKRAQKRSETGKSAFYRRGYL